MAFLSLYNAIGARATKAQKLVFWLSAAAATQQLSLNIKGKNLFFGLLLL